MAAAQHRDRRARQRARRREAVRMADYSTIGLAFPIAIAMCWFVGGWVGGWFGASSAGHWIGGAFGLAAGFYNVFRTAQLLQQQDEIGLQSLPEEADGSGVAEQRPDGSSGSSGPSRAAGTES